jgi:hypothetical protein
VIGLCSILTRPVKARGATLFCSELAQPVSNYRTLSTGAQIFHSPYINVQLAPLPELLCSRETTLADRSAVRGRPDLCAMSTAALVQNGCADPASDRGIGSSGVLGGHWSTLVSPFIFLLFARYPNSRIIYKPSFRITAFDGQNGDDFRHSYQA